MKVIRWRWADTKNTKHNTWQGRSLDRVQQQMGRYWLVRLEQRSPADVVFRARNSGPNGKAMAQDRNTIWVNADFRWGTSAAAREQMARCATHELGHWLVQGNGKDGHAATGNVMAQVVGDPWINWTLADMLWFGGLAWRSSLRPWHEPMFWYPKQRVGLSRFLFGAKKIEDTWEEIPLC